MLVKCTWNILFVAFALAICLENGYSEETEKKAEPKKAAASEATKDADKKSDADAKKSASQKKEENKGEAKPAEEEKVVDPFAVPKEGTGKEMVNFIKKIASKAHRGPCPPESSTSLSWRRLFLTHLKRRWPMKNWKLNWRSRPWHFVFARWIFNDSWKLKAPRKQNWN